MIDGVRAFAPSLAASHESFESESYARLATLEESSFWFRSRNRLIVWTLARYFPRASRLLEIGCGSGFVIGAIASAYSEMRITATELLSEAFKHARERAPSVEFLQADATAIPFDSEFDVAGAFDVIEHIDDDERVLRELFRVLRPGGGLLLTVPRHRFLWSVSDDYGHHKRRYTGEELKRKVRAAGFRIVRVTSFVSLLLPLLILSRMKMRKAKPSAVWSEFTLPKAIDVLLSIVMMVERLLIRGGISFPFGGSLLVVARRPQ